MSAVTLQTGTTTEPTYYLVLKTPLARCREALTQAGLAVPDDLTPELLAQFLLNDLPRLLEQAITTRQQTKLKTLETQVRGALAQLLGSDQIEPFLEQIEEASLQRMTNAAIARIFPAAQLPLAEALAQASFDIPEDLTPELLAQFLLNDLPPAVLAAETGEELIELVALETRVKNALQELLGDGRSVETFLQEAQERIGSAILERAVAVAAATIRPPSPTSELLSLLQEMAASADFSEESRAVFAAYAEQVEQSEQGADEMLLDASFLLLHHLQTPSPFQTQMFLFLERLLPEELTAWLEEYALWTSNQQAFERQLELEAHADAVVAGANAVIEEMNQVGRALDGEIDAAHAQRNALVEQMQAATEALRTLARTTLERAAAVKAAADNAGRAVVTAEKRGQRLNTLAIDALHRANELL